MRYTLPLLLVSASWLRDITIFIAFNMLMHLFDLLETCGRHLEANLATWRMRPRFFLRHNCEILFFLEIGEIQVYDLGVPSHHLFFGHRIFPYFPPIFFWLPDSNLHLKWFRSPSYRKSWHPRKQSWRHNWESWKTEKQQFYILVTWGVNICKSDEISHSCEDSFFVLHLTFCAVVGNRPTDGRVIFLPWLHFFLAGVWFFFPKIAILPHVLCFCWVFGGFRGGVGGWDNNNPTACSAAWSSLAFPHELDAPLVDLLLHFYMNLMLRCLIFSRISTWTWYSAAWSSLACLHELDAPLLDLLLHFYMNLMLRCLIFSYMSTWTWCPAVWSSLAFLPELDAPLRDLLLHFYMNPCSAAWSSRTCLHELDAPLFDLLLHFYLSLMLRCVIFSRISTWTWCCAAWSSLTCLHELDAPLLDLLLHFYLNLILRCLIFSCISTWTWCCAAWSSLAFLPELDAPLLDLLFFMLPKRLLDTLKWPQQPFGEVAAIVPQNMTKLRWKKVVFFGPLNCWLVGKHAKHCKTWGKMSIPFI